MKIPQNIIQKRTPERTPVGFVAALIVRRYLLSSRCECSFVIVKVIWIVGQAGFIIPTPTQVGVMLTSTRQNSLSVRLSVQCRSVEKDTNHPQCGTESNATATDGQ